MIARPWPRGSGEMSSLRKLAGPLSYAAHTAAQWAAIGAWLIATGGDRRNLWAVSEMLAGLRRTLAGKPSPHIRDFAAKLQLAEASRREWQQVRSPGIVPAIRRTRRYLHEIRNSSPA